jgi:hypothetical protein
VTDSIMTSYGSKQKSIKIAEKWDGRDCCGLCSARALPGDRVNVSGTSLNPSVRLLLSCSNTFNSERPPLRATVEGGKHGLQFCHKIYCSRVRTYTPGANLQVDKGISAYRTIETANVSGDCGDALPALLPGCRKAKILSEFKQ